MASPMGDKDDVKRSTDIVELIGEYIDLAKAGRNFRARCPFHNERTPSFMVNPELQYFKCFGCGESGDVFSFLQKYEGMEFSEALQFLAERAGIELRRSYRKDGEKDELYEINRLAAHFYHYILVKHEKGEAARAYLGEVRGIKKDLFGDYRLGFAPGGKRDALIHFLKNKGIEARKLVKAGLAVETKYGLMDRFSGRVIFPIRDTRGRVIALGGRILPGADQKLAKYINSPETPIYRKSESLYGIYEAKESIRESKWAVLVEGELDVLGSVSAGVGGVVASKGTAVTPEQIQLIRRYADHLVLAMDSDFAGDVSAKKAIFDAMDAGLEVRVAEMGRYKDPDEFAKNDAQGYKNALHNAVEVWDFLIDSTIRTESVEGGFSKSRISKKLVPILAEIPDRIVQAHYVGELARKLSVPEESVAQEIEKQFGRGGSREGSPREELEKGKVELGRRDLLERRILSIVFQEGPGENHDEYFDLLSTNLGKRLVDAYFDFVESGYKYEISVFADFLPLELRGAFHEMMMEISAEDIMENELERAAEELRKLNYNEELQRLGETISRLEKKGNLKALEDAKRKFVEISSKAYKRGDFEY